MSSSSPTHHAGRVVFFKGHRFIVLAHTAHHAAVCPIITAPCTHHRADYAPSWGESLTLGLRSDDVIRCRPLLLPSRALIPHDRTISAHVLQHVTDRAQREATRQHEETHYRGYVSSSLAS